MPTRNPKVWFEIYVDDLKRAQTFYKRILNIKLDVLPIPDGMEVYVHGAGGTLIKMQDFKAGGNSTIVYFGSTDCSIEEARIEAAGGKVLQSKQALGEYGFMVLALDSEGNTIGVHSQK